ncbi:glycosyltransferase [Alkalibacter saccharofermentans]|uniref:CDP-glycerol glycerophosphotransferase n=1 Tax=Alkalibacter saccharofermentans DSM 14828 TaxID=1120975 RepID=A0A1M4Y225_9FIRM|nr:glycosyltransferase [Alkalibacter saccharofermentans]SHE99730.1 CDP-glycerol glycerophosphotransferase [Alkalibacter saccharofermentans DSM 14828]
MKTTKKIVKKLFNKNYMLKPRYTTYMKKHKLDPNIILYQSYQGKSMTGNPYAVFKELLSDKSMTHVWALDNDMNINPEYGHLDNVKFVTIHSKDYLRYLTTAKYLINNTSFPYYFQKMEGQIYINTWHGTPLKTLGLDIKDTHPTAHANIQRNLLQTDYLVMPNSFTAEKLLDSHHCNGIFGGKVLDTGYPRVDLTLSYPSDKMKNILGVEKSKKIILYAPTWRGQVGRESDTSQKLLEDVNYLKDNIPSEYCVLLKAHYFTYDYFKKNNLEHLCVPDGIDTNELLSAIDVLITDYSSIFFDFIPTGRPVLYYAEDFEEYERTRGFYIDTKTLPGPICSTLEQLAESISSLSQIKEDYREKYNAFLETYCSKDDGQATRRFIDIIFHDKNSDYVKKVVNHKTKILMHCGSFENNGITVSAISLLNSIDFEKYDVTVTTTGKMTGAKERNLNKLDKRVKVIHRIGTLNKTIWEGFKHFAVREFPISPDSFLPADLYKRELKRIIGDTVFDVGIDFGGYNILWSLLIANGSFNKKIIYQHNDMLMEYQKIINGKQRHKKNLKIIFSIYKKYDVAASVSKSALEANAENLKEYFLDFGTKLVYVNNAINYEHILNMKDQAEFATYKGKPCLVLPRDNATNLIEGIVLDPQETKFINIGRLSPEKGQDKLISAFAELCSEYDNLKLYIVGEGVLEKALKDQAKRLKVSDRVVFTGQLSNAFALLNLCDCFVLSSNYEGQGLVLLEALVLNKPTISTDVTGAHSVLEGGYGLLVDNTAEALREGMERFIKGEKLSNKTFDYKSYNIEALDMFYSMLE